MTLHALVERLNCITMTSLAIQQWSWLTQGKCSQSVVQTSERISLRLCIVRCMTVRCLLRSTQITRLSAMIQIGRKSNAKKTHSGWCRWLNGRITENVREIGRKVFQSLTLTTQRNLTRLTICQTLMMPCWLSRVMSKAPAWMRLTSWKWNTLTCLFSRAVSDTMDSKRH